MANNNAPQQDATPQSQTVGLYNGERAEMETAWRLVRLLLGGTDALRRAGEEFTPRTAREDKEPNLYTKRMKLSTLVPAFEDATDDIASRPFQKPPVLKEGESLSPELRRIEIDADRMGLSLSAFASQQFADLVRFGMSLTLVDNVVALDSDGKPMDRADAERIDARPYLVRIIPDNLVGFRVEKRFGREVCTELRVREWAYARPRGSFQDQLVERVRVWTGSEVSLWERNYGNTVLAEDRALLVGRGDPSGFTMIEGPTPTGFPDDEIPIVVAYAKQVGFMHAKPPMLQLAHMNLDHWNKTSVHDNGVRYSMHPTLLLKGVKKKETEERPKLGEGSVFITDSDIAEAKYVEITGSSFAASMERIKQVESQLQRLASDPLQSGSATATGEVRGEMRSQSQAQSWVERFEWALYRMYEFAARWLGEKLPEGFNVTLYRESSMMLVANPQRTVSLQNDVKEGRLTLVTYLNERKRSGDFADDFDPEAEAAAIEDEKAASDAARMDAMAAQIEAERAKNANGGQPVDPAVQEAKPGEQVDKKQAKVPA